MSSPFILINYYFFVENCLVLSEKSEAEPFFFVLDKWHSACLSFAATKFSVESYLCMASALKALWSWAKLFTTEGIDDRGNLKDEGIVERGR